VNSTPRRHRRCRAEFVAGRDRWPTGAPPRAGAARIVMPTGVSATSNASKNLAQRGGEDRLKAQKAGHAVQWAIWGIAQRRRSIRGRGYGTAEVRGDGTGEFRGQQDRKNRNLEGEGQISNCGVANGWKILTSKQVQSLHAFSSWTLDKRDRRTLSGAVYRKPGWSERKNCKNFLCLDFWRTLIRNCRHEMRLCANPEANHF